MKCAGRIIARHDIALFQMLRRTSDRVGHIALQAFSWIRKELGLNVNCCVIGLLQLSVDHAIAADHGPFSIGFCTASEAYREAD